MICVTHQRFGLLLVLIGTVALAFAVQIKEFLASDRADAEKRNPDFKGLSSTARFTIRPYFFYGGLILIGIGTALQW